MKRKIFSILLAAIMCFAVGLASPVSASSFAKGDEVKIKAGAADLNRKVQFFDFVYEDTYVLMENPAADGSVAFSPQGEKPATGRVFVKDLIPVSEDIASPIEKPSEEQYSADSAALIDALSGYNADVSFTLTDSVSLYKGVFISSNPSRKNVVLNLNGHTLTITEMTPDVVGMAIDNATLTVNGPGVVNITAHSIGLGASRKGVLAVTGDAIINIYGGTNGVDVNGGSNVTVTGNVEGGNFGIIVFDNGTTVNVGGSVTSGHTGVLTNGEINATIDGELIVPDDTFYIRENVDGKDFLNMSQYQSVTTKEGYRTYTVGPGTVWVKAF